MSAIARASHLRPRVWRPLAVARVAQVLAELLPIPRQIPLDVPPVLQIARQLGPIVLELLAGLAQPLPVRLDGRRVGAVAQVVPKLLPRVVKLAPVPLGLLPVVADLGILLAESLPVLLNLLEVAADFG